MGFLSVLSMAHKWIAERALSGDTVIDATAGGGVDTLALAELVGPKGRVYAFDIQPSALERTRERLVPLSESGRMPDLRLLLQDHAGMVDAVDPDDVGKVAAIMFNLGYLPGGDQSVITQPETTIEALQASLTLLRAGGIVTCVLYPGHPGGEQEAAAVEDWAASLPQSVGQAVIYRQLQRTAAPYVIAIERKR
ncbi:class I SAM-dependent methyltransferase [Paenibacillus sp. GSMTC-2017]|uniref:class I SAM-dependent methyltransferase n=1 Tax=Paenibacillus sp. GSMTC-2017 TaxID=2794350 RepID=UPI0018D8482C|nr:class I SAM-dependent methyltransferase [Paenibacillus sp. GSMTC-2017]MBH5317388.1 class I SAM-dependent methyltransferase [Paenibacillus sp. GSMTC-2017]